MRTGPRSLEIAIVAFAIALAACESAGRPAPTGGSGSGTGAGGGQAQGGAGGEAGAGGQGGSADVDCDVVPACYVCIQCAVDGPCQAEYDACTENPECFALFTCHENCGGNNPPCEADCAQMHPGGAADFGPLEGCFQGACVMSCGAGGG